MNYDCIVLGAGIIGVSSALQLQARGRNVCLIDKLEPGEGTSFGNAGLIERSSVIPYAFPRELSKLIRYAFNNQSDVRYDFSYLPKAAPWLAKYWWHSAPARLTQAAADMWPLIQRCVTEHDKWVAQAGLEHLIRPKGWIEVFRNQEVFDHALQDIIELDFYHLNYDVLGKQQLHEREPTLKASVKGGIHWLDPKTVTDPSLLTKGYAQLFVKLGGTLTKGDANTLKQTTNGWSVQTDEQTITANNAVIALGADSASLLKKLGHYAPLGIKRGYHKHYQVEPEQVLQHSICDHLAGFILAPMKNGIRLTTGAEFADPNKPANEIQLKRAEAIARTIYPLGEPIETTPWLGRRPCMPDMRPVIGAVPNTAGLWTNFGHAHHGLTLGPISGRLLADLITGEKPFTDPAPYSIKRFN